MEATDHLLEIDEPENESKPVATISRSPSRCSIILIGLLLLFTGVSLGVSWNITGAKENQNRPVSEPLENQIPANDGINEPWVTETTPAEDVINIDMPFTNPKATAQTIKQYSGTGGFRMNYKWVSRSDLPDGSIINKQGPKFELSHVELPTTEVLADEKEIIAPNGRELGFSDWSFSQDLRQILLTTNRNQGWRHSFFATYWIYDVKNKATRPLAFSESDKKIPNQLGSGQVSLTVWSPIGHNIAWVRDNDLFVTIDDQEFRVTTDGSKNIINGIADWVYEEEVFSEQKATWFGPDGLTVAFVKFNDTLVQEFEIQYYAKYGENQYPNKVDLKYPKVIIVH